ncbi:AfsR/SARP family transcriptional regulator [Actinospica robiniae]|uniref:AfsR/SARP family transcriptional regulator n=1 Tax=Actinospica robiniae TaxID=304901 RepID=UPI00040D5ED4|nr:AfsR/SARP family transcriptional regulator [Actinospica robiniae]
MHYQLLGSVEIHGPLCSVAAVGKDAVFLAELLVHADSVVTSAHLAQELWPRRSPRDPANAVQVRASRLRALLRSAGGGRAAEMLQTRYGGYRLDRSGATTDVGQYEDAVKLASASTAQCSPAAAVTAFDRARACWRGDPLPGVPVGECLSAEMVRVLELRLTAEEEWADAALRLGRPDVAVAALTPLLGLHPYRERLHELAIRALEQSGRKPEALVVYARLRALLREDLGTEPGTELRDLHIRLLRTESTEAGREVARSHATPAVPPAQLPMPTPFFVGRDRDMARIRAALSGAGAQTTRIVAVTGMAGVGKSALAVAAAHRLRPDFPDGQLYLNLQSATPGLAPVEVVHAAAALLRSLGVDSSRIPQDAQEATALLRSILAPTRTLLLLDDARSAAQVRRLLPAGPGCAVLVTSRTSLASLDNALHIRLSPMDAEDGVSLIALASARGRTEIESAAGRRLIEQCGRLPLALRIIAARLATRDALTIQDLADQLTERPRLLSYLETDGLSVRDAFTSGYEALSHADSAADRQAGTALVRIGALDLPEYSAPLMAHLIGTDEEQAARALDRLVEVALLEEPRLGRYAPHDLIRAFARELAASPEGARESVGAARRATRWYAEVSEHAAAFLTNSNSERDIARSRFAEKDREHFDDRASALAWCEREASNLLALTYRLRNERDTDGDAALLQIPYHLHRYLATSGRIQELLEVGAIALAAARRRREPVAEAHALGALAEGHFYAGSPEQALPLQRGAAEIYQRLGSRRDEQVVLDNLALLLATIGRDEEATELLERNLATARTDHDHYRESLILSHLGHSKVQTDPRRAIDHFLSSMEAGTRADSPLMQTAGNSNIGKAYLALGEPAAALEHLDNALAADEKGPWNVERDSRLCRCRALRALGRYAEAAKDCEALLDLAKTRHDRYGQGLAHHELGLLMASIDDSGAALNEWIHAERALAGSESAILTEVRSLINRRVDETPGAAPTSTTPS